VAGGKITEDEQQAASQIIFFSPLESITQEYGPLEVYFPWEPADQGQKIIVLEYQLSGDYFPWDPDEQELRT
jgi:hypothetical protein